MTIAALILAGGESKRFNSKIPKQFHKIHNELMINHSIKKLLSIKKISQIILVINRSKFRKYKEFITKHKKNGSFEPFFYFKNTCLIFKLITGCLAHPHSQVLQ